MPWTPFNPHTATRQGDIPNNLVRVNRDSSLIISPDLAQRLGEPNKVTLLTNGDPTKIGIRTYEGGPDERGYRFKKYSRTQGWMVGAHTLIWRAGKVVRAAQPLTHTWDGDVLVVDISSLPNRGGR